MNKPEKIIVHHSLTADNVVLSSFDAIRNYHMKEKGWNDIAYHYVLEYVNNKIVVRPGRAENVIGAHTQGQNDKSLGICVVGDFDKVEPTPEMYLEVAKLCVKLRKKYGKLPVEPHSKYAKKSCPGYKFSLAKVRGRITQEEKAPSTPVVVKPSTPVKYGVVTAHLLNVREGKSKESKVIGKLKQNEKVKLDKLTGDWWSIYFGDHGGFVHKDFIKI